MTDEPKRGRGRPSKGDAARGKMVGIRFTAEEMGAIESRADAEGLSAAGWIRRAVLEDLGTD